MEMPTAGALAAEYRQALQPLYSPGELRAIIRMVFASRVGFSFPELEPDRKISPQDAASLHRDLARLAAGEPVQYVLGTVLFHGLTLKVDPRALIPRPETEELVERIASSLPFVPACIVDVGTGSGCIALALKNAYPGARVIGIDKSTDALALARENGEALGLPVEWAQADALGAELAPLLQRTVQGPGNLLVSNPPYVPRTDAAEMAPQVVVHEPHAALFVGEDDPQQFYRAICQAAEQALHPGDVLWLEAHYRHAPATAALVLDAGFSTVDLLRDSSGNYRYIHAVW